jgi:hypothetical protein
MRVLWLWSILECSPELVALLGGVVAVQMPRALLLQQVFEAAGGLLRVLLRRALDSRDSVVWIALAVGTRVVVVPIALVPVFCLLLPRMASYLALALPSSSTQEVIMSLRWVMELGRRWPKSSKVRRW